MKYKIEDLKDITDSREIMNSSPKGFSKYMTYIIVSLLTIMIMWSLFAHKEISVKASGEIRPSNEVTKVSSGVLGNITNLNIKDGDKVKEGDILLVVNGAEYVLQRELFKENLDKKNKELTALNKLKESVLDGTSKFDLNDEIQKQYNKKFELYLENLNSNNSQGILTETQKSEINIYISDLELLKKGIEESINYFNESNALYYQYKDYELAMNNYSNIINSYQSKIAQLQSQITDANKTQVAAEINTLRDNISSSQGEKTKYKNTTIMNITSEVSQNKSKLSQLAVSTNVGNYKEQYLTSVEGNISNLETSLSDIKMNLEAAQAKVDATSIKAPCCGVINMISSVKVGDYIQNGTEIASIVPEDRSTFNVEVYIDNQSFGEIREGQDVVVELISLPGSEYGYIKSTLKNISVDAKVSKTEKGSASYYTAKCPIEEKFLTNKKGECVNIKNGMLAQVRVINREVSYFRYFLEKIDILD